MKDILKQTPGLDALTMKGLRVCCYYVAIYLLLSLANRSHACHFPDYVQSNVTAESLGRDWRGKISEQNKETSLK